MQTLMPPPDHIVLLIKYNQFFMVIFGQGPFGFCWPEALGIFWRVNFCPHSIIPVT